MLLQLKFITLACVASAGFFLGLVVSHDTGEATGWLVISSIALLAHGALAYMSHWVVTQSEATLAYAKHSLTAVDARFEELKAARYRLRKELEAHGMLEERPEQDEVQH